MKINLENLLKEKNKSIYWLAKEANLSYPSLYNLVNEKTTSISFSSLEKICQALECTPNDIFTFSKNIGT